MGKKKPKTIRKNVITIEDVTKADQDRGWRIATGKTQRLVDVNARPIPIDAEAAIVAARDKQLPCTFLLSKSGKVYKYQEASFEI